MQPLPPVDTVPLFEPLLEELLPLLRSLDAADWERPTLAGRWRVHDVAAHLLDGDLRRLSAARDGHALAPGARVEGHADLVRLIDGLNAQGVQYGRRLSPRLLIDLLEITGRWVAAHVAALPPHGEAHFPVAWAGEARSENWMDVGREYTERWHHQMQIRDAVGAPLLLEPRWLVPVLELSVRAFPRAYAGVVAPEGTSVAFEVAGVPGGVWTTRMERDGWRVHRGREGVAHATVRLTPDEGWRLLYNALPAERARETLAIEGDLALAEPLLRARSVMV